MGKQKRSENTYTKINTIFYRDANNVIMPYDGYVMPELEYLKDCKFDATEKIDGTNIRIEVSSSVTPEKVTFSVDFKGKTDNSQIPAELLEYLKTTFPSDKVLSALGLKSEMLPEDAETIDKNWVIDGQIDVEKVPFMYTLYGEGYGRKIQKCGGNYLSDSVSFIGFDVKVNDTYLLRDNMLTVFARLDCPTVPYIGQMTIQEAIEYVKKGFISTISENREFRAEGLVLKSPCELKTRFGERICFKVKTRDWNKYYSMYKTYDKVDQPINDEYVR